MLFKDGSFSNTVDRTTNNDWQNKEFNGSNLESNNLVTEAKSRRKKKDSDPHENSFSLV